MKTQLPKYLSGDKIFGDDFVFSEIEKWYKDEEEGYADLVTQSLETYEYPYYSLNNFHAFNYLQGHKFEHALGVGSAYGSEFLPIVGSISSITILDPSNVFSSNSKLHGIPCKYVKPRTDGTMLFETGSFDLLTCLGVLHHIPNVSYVIEEFYRCLSPGGYALIREPIVSMGDWSRARVGLTKRERGIPLQPFRKAVNDAGFQVISERLCMCPVVSKLVSEIGLSTYNNDLLTRIDYVLSVLTQWNLHYYSRNFLEKISPTSVYFLLMKPFK